ncbi:DinB family protein [Spongisporangium articulatum]|uniref:DinB family protein n=1 Tax=Spongisporangium articulatum TaxID=3362603 RepID=A0ABW8ALJ8_9ACTN
MDTRELLVESFGRLPGLVHGAVKGLTVETLSTPPAPGGNTIGWLVWHLTRVQDDHVAEVAGTEQVWTTSWARTFGLPFDDEATGYGQSADDVLAVRVGPELLTGYFDAVHAATQEFLKTLTDEGLDTVVDDNWDPPVTLGVRLVSVLSDDLQHAGQANYVRGLLT